MRTWFVLACWTALVVPNVALCELLPTKPTEVPPETTAGADSVNLATMIEAKEEMFPLTVEPEPWVDTVWKDCFVWEEVGTLDETRCWVDWPPDVVADKSDTSGEGVEGFPEPVPSDLFEAAAEVAPLTQNPEPATLVLVVVGGLSLLGFAARRNLKKSRMATESCGD